MSMSDLQTTTDQQTPDDDIAVEVSSSFSEGFRVQDQATANWVARKIVEARLHRERVKAWCEREVRRSEQLEERFWYLYGSQLREWAASELRRLGGRRKSLDLPDARVGWRAEAMRVIVDDESAALEWATSTCPAAIVVTRRISRSAIKSHFESKGECPTGARVEPAGEKFYLR